MKSPEQIKLYLIDTMHSMFRRPKMYAPTAESFEIQVLHFVDLYCFIDEKDLYDQLSGGSWRRWRKFCHNEVAHNGVFSVATFLEKQNQLDDNWSILIKLLEKFCLSLSVPVAA